MTQASDFLHEGWADGTIRYSFDLSGTWRFPHPLNPIQGSNGLVTLSFQWQERFEAAMDAWEAVANVRFIETALSDADLVIGWYWLDGPGGAAGHAWGWDSDGDGRYDHNHHEGYVVRMDPEDTDVFSQTAVRELGHVLGLGGIEHTPSIMASTNIETAPTAYDVQVIQELYGPPSLGFPPIFGTDADDRLSGTAAADEIHGRNGKDTISGDDGDDTLFGNIGTDQLWGGGGDDLIFAGQNGGPLRTASDGSLRHLDGEDWLWGGDGNDTLCGQYGDDVLVGGKGGDADDDDVLFGGKGDDVLYGGRGDDILVGNRGDDSLYGGPGSNSFYFDHNSGNDVISTLDPYLGSRDDLFYIKEDVNGSGIRSGQDVLARISSNQHGTPVIDLGGGNSITWYYDVTQLSASDFIIY